ncbi:TerB family tellurite resistance protein [Rhodoferax sp.]|uniref:tellurite resistance TerB family protein n=1 Tax=Rhodoferax sp. TaxID=50421 RepID=UPI0025FFE87E|nr:TerB family tellurite resistance protein [Rhodoferax sp.]
MLRALKDIFDDLVAQATEPSPAERQHAQNLATAVLLVEVMRADPAKTAVERQAVVLTLQQRLQLDGAALTQLMQQAEQSAAKAYDYQRFTSSINEHCTQAQKIQIVEDMWQVAYADGTLGAVENSVINQVAGLLYVTHGEYIGAKMRAKEAAGLLL